MHAQVLDAPGHRLRAVELPTPKPGADQVLVRVRACGVCRTDLHIVDGELTRPKLPLVLGHQIVGTVAQLGEAVEGLRTGQSVGIPWLGGACGRCRQCDKGQENLCESAVFTGYSQDGGFAQYALASGPFALPMPAGLSELEAAPLLCAGVIGYRALRMTGDAERLGLYGFGSAAHIITQVARFQGREVLAFTRAGDVAAQRFAASLGATWAGGSDEDPPVALDAAIIFAPAGALVPRALRALAPGGAVVCAGIYMSEIPPFPYELLWQERSIRSVANLTRQDGVEFLELAPKVPVRTHIERYPLDEAERALNDLRGGRLIGSAVIDVGG
jgi:propanol-preferring alcohol dehydrogenase